MARRDGGSWAARIAALAALWGCVGLTLFAGWNLVKTPYSWATLSWAGGLVVGVLATPYVLRFLYIVTVLSTWPNDPRDFGAAENRLWWLGHYVRTMTLPYGLLVVASLFGWRLSVGDSVPLYWPWCVMIILAYALIVMVVSGGIPAAPDMPYLQPIPLSRRWAFLVSAAVVVIFAVMHFVELKWLRIVLFVAVFSVVIFWTTAAVAIGAARLFLRVDHGHSTSHPLDWPWHKRPPQ